MNCPGKHTKYQPEEVEWKCSTCGAEAGTFAIMEPAAGALEDCELLHDDDAVGCYDCGNDNYESGRSFARRIQTKKHLVACPHCKGKGLVKAKAKSGKKK